MHNLNRHGCVPILIQLDVSFEVILEVRQIGFQLAPERCNAIAENPWKHIFPPESERRRYSMRAIRLDKRPGCCDELRNASVCTTVNQCLANVHSLADFSDQIIDLRGRGATFLHSRAVQVEMADITSGAILVRLFAQHDLINESRGGCVRPRTPWDFDASLGPLQRLQKRHEVPYCKDMVFHEDTEVG